MKKTTLAAAAAVLGVLALAGCAQEYTPGGTAVSVVHIDVDGTEVACVVAGNGGVDCDWDGAQP